MPEDSQTPSNIGRYEVKRLLGAGAMGSVYLAEDPRIKRRVAIKIVKADLLLNEADRHEVLARFQREAEVSGLLNHPGIVTIFDFGESEFGAFLAMEFVEGRPLDAIIKAGEVMSLMERFRILLGIGEALDHAHSKGIVHRDVKPGNIMIALDGHPKLMDFGIAKREDASLTQTGTFLGTPSYASPEQIREGIVDNRSDIFSFGVMAFEVFAGRTPFPGSSINTILYKIVNEPPAMPDPPLEGVFPEAWKRNFEKVLAKKPQDRYASCVEFLNDLAHGFKDLDPALKVKLEHRATGSIPLMASSSTPLPTIQTESRTVFAPPPKKSLLLPGIALGLLVLGGLGYWRFKPLKETAVPPPAAQPTAAAPSDKPTETPSAKTTAEVADPGPQIGVLKVSGSYGVRLKVDGQDLGDIGAGKAIELPLGPHQLELSNAKVFYREGRRVTLVAGKALSLAPPALVSVTVYTFPGSGLVTVDGQATGVESVGEKTITLVKGTHVFGILGKSARHSAEVTSDGQVIKFGGVPAQ